MGARERRKQRDLTDSALVGARQRWWAMIQVVLQVHIRVTEWRWLWPWVEREITLAPQRTDHDLA